MLSLSGTCKFSGSLSSFAPAQLNGAYPGPSRELRSRCILAVRRNIDRDYARWRSDYIYGVDNRKRLVQIYHGEYHYNYPAGLPFYGGSGMAIAEDNGASFLKSAKSSLRHLTQQQFYDLNEKGGLPVDGFMIEADASDNYVAPNAPVNQVYATTYSPTGIQGSTSRVLLLLALQKQTFSTRSRSTKRPSSRSTMPLMALLMAGTGR